MIKFRDCFLSQMGTVHYSFLYSQYLSYYLTHGGCPGNVYGVNELNIARHLEVNIGEFSHAHCERVLGL